MTARITIPIPIRDRAAISLLLRDSTIPLKLCAARSVIRPLARSDMSDFDFDDRKGTSPRSVPHSHIFDLGMSRQSVIFEANIPALDGVTNASLDKVRHDRRRAGAVRRPPCEALKPRERQHRDRA
jgi:hypothetical protein